MLKLWLCRRLKSVLTLARLYFQVGIVIANEVFPEAIEYFLGKVEGDGSDSEDEEDDDDDAEEIDLEKPRTKKRKM